MIPILFESTATSFSTFGIGVLKDATSCEVIEERNGAYELTLKYPTNGSMYPYIKKERLIVAKPNDNAQNQAFRIYKISLPINGIITVYAQHISYDLLTIGVTPFSLDSATPTQAMEQVFGHSYPTSNFTFQTDYSTAKTFSVDKPQNVRSLVGGASGSLLDLWGGEFEFDNFKIYQHSSRGLDRGVVIEYGKNLTKFQHDSDITDAYTHILPYGVATDEDGNETVVTLPEGILPLQSTILANGKVYIKDFTDKFKEDEKVTEDTLRTKAEAWIKANPIGVEETSLTISFEPLWNQSEYASIYEKVSLCDTVTIRHGEYGIGTKMKVRETVYDCLVEKYKSITLGSSKSDMVSQVADIKEEIAETKKAVDRFPILLTSAISNATKLITGNKGGCVVLHTDTTDGKPYELFIMDSDKLEEAVNVWRWNLGGLGFSSHGYNGPYETAITADGSIVANFITSGTLLANIIKAGTISSLDGSSYWNIETGEIKIKAYATTADLDEQTERIDGIEEQKMYRLVIASSNGNIFKNGEISTVLSARVYSWDEDVTDSLDDNQFIWTRVSNDSDDDLIWNQKHAGGTKEITITNDDVKVRATFCCDLIDTTTRESLL